MAKLTATQEFLLKRTAEKDAEDAQDRGPGESRTPRVDMVLDSHRDGM